MSADANSAFGDALGSRKPRRRHPDDREYSGFLQQSYTPSESHPTPGPHLGTVPRGVPLPTAINAKATPVPHADWLEHQAPAQPVVETLVQKLHQQVTKTFSDQVAPVRLASHLSVLAVAALILVLSQVEMPDWSFSLRAFPDAALLDSSNGATSQVTALVNQQNGGGIAGNESLQRAAVPFTIVHQPPTAEGIQVYVVQPGDTVLAIAEKHGINPETIMWSNPGLELNADLIRPGDKLNILPVNGVLHTITSGDTLLSIAEKYKVTVEDILGYPGNGLTDANGQLTIGNQLVIPNGTKPFVVQEAVAYSGGAVPASAKIGSGTFLWPASGSINQRFWSGHGGIDIGGWTGAPVKAADGGYVAVAAGGWNGGYGNHVIVDHGNGFVTLYAHLNSIYVKPGESVTRGQQLGSIGNTGNSTGPHLHFELRYQGVPRNPLSYLP